MSKRKPKAVVWVVIHCEFMQRSGDPKDGAFMDEMVFHVASSLREVERWMRPIHTAAHGWWKVERRVVDQDDIDADDRPETHFFNYRGQPRKSPLHKAALRAFDKHVKWVQELLATRDQKSADA